MNNTTQSVDNLCEKMKPSYDHHATSIMNNNYFSDKFQDGDSVVTSNDINQSISPLSSSGGSNLNQDDPPTEDDLSQQN